MMALAQSSNFHVYENNLKRLWNAGSIPVDQGRAWNSVPNELSGPAEVAGLLTLLLRGSVGQSILSALIILLSLQSWSYKEKYKEKKW